VDSFHTGYNLLALRDIWQHTGWAPAAEALRTGFQYYRKNFFPGNGTVKYFGNRTFPIDTHALAHAIITLVELKDMDPGNMDLAKSILDWTLINMRHPSGYFYFQKWPRFTNRIAYMRWSQAWMLYAMARIHKAITHQQ
jgi:hypothetical protein